MNNLLETLGVLEARQGHSRIGVLGTGDVAADHCVLRSGQPSREGATSTSTSTTQPPTIVLLLVC